MHLIDTNVLIVAVNVKDTRHDVARSYLERLLSEGSGVLIAPASFVGFVRQATRVIGGLPGLTVDEAFRVVELLLERPGVVVAAPDERHFSRVRELLQSTGVNGKHVDDAHLAALALQYRATILTFDSDFARFPEVKWERPAA
jgi:toxin-antitoxin system PIN domain toxin